MLTQDASLRIGATVTITCRFSIRLTLTQASCADSPCDNQEGDAERHDPNWGEQGGEGSVTDEEDPQGYGNRQEAANTSEATPQ